MWLGLGTLLVAVVLVTLRVVVPLIEPPPRRARLVSLVVVPPPEQEDLIDDSEPEQTYDGQIVEITAPEEEVVPEDSEYLSEYDVTVEEETRSERFEINPEVLAKVFSEEQVAEQADVIDLNVEEDSTGATVGNQRFDPNVDGTLASVPSPWAVTNRVGPQDPVRSSQVQSMMSGAPQNDLLDEARGDAVNLNTTRYPWAGYMDRIRRQVNFWWQQNLDNLPSSVRLAKPSYTTEVEVFLDANGVLEHIEVTESSSVPELDDAVVRAFQVAGPFDNPPVGLIGKDGRVRLPDFSFTVRQGIARVQYRGIDPRAGVQFPGILKSPR